MLFDEVTNLREDKENLFLRERQRREDIAFYTAFRNSPLQPTCRKVFYPGCGNDDAVTEAFPESEVILLDHNRRVIDQLRRKQHGTNVHVIEASAADYDPGSVDVLLLHGFGEDLDTLVGTVVNGGFVLTDTGSVLCDSLLLRSDLELVGVLCPARDAGADAVNYIQQLQQQRQEQLKGIVPDVVFRTGQREYAMPVETDEEFQFVDPALYAHVQEEKNFFQRPDSDSVLAYAQERHRHVPRKKPGAAFFIYRKVCNRTH